MKRVVLFFFAGCLLTIIFIPVVFAQAVPDVNLSQAWDLIAGNWKTYGILGALGGALSVAISMFAKFFPDVWGKLGKLWRYVLAFVITGAGIGLLAYVGGSALLDSIVAGVFGGLASIGINQGFKRVGEKLKNPFA
jgi:hypothetical protein